MSLRSKIILVLSGVVVLYAIIDNAFLRFMVSSRFVALEEQFALNDVETFTQRLAAEVDHLDFLCSTWATEKGLADLVAGRVGDPAEVGFTPERLASSDLDLLYLCAPDARVVWGRIEANGTDQVIKVKEFPSEALAPFHRALPRREETSSKGPMITTSGPMLVSAHRVGPEDNRHTLVVGRFIDERLTHVETKRGTVTFDLLPAVQESLAESERHLFDEITDEKEGAVLSMGDDGLMHAYEPIRDIGERPQILLRVNIEPNITRAGGQAVLFAGLTAAASALLILFVLLRLLQKIVLRPISRLTNHAVEIGKTDDTTKTLDLERLDEIGTLANEFDRMMGKLAQSREQTVKTARLAGMSEIATGVLHNVGNVLNSVNVSTNLVTKKAQQLAVGDLGMMTHVLEAHADDLGAFVANDPKGKHLLPFLSQLSESLSTQQQDLVQELKSLGSGIDHIAELVRSQQSYAGTKGVFEKASLKDQLENAVKICSQAYRGVEDMTIVREFEDVDSVSVDKHKLMEILVNLIQNARQAMDDAGVEAKRLVLRLMAIDGRARIEVEDNGIGISPENLSRVFHHGFTTKSDGHGFGLHVSANAATEMKSSLYARSDGPGRGATFVLDIPLNAEEPARAA